MGARDIPRSCYGLIPLFLLPPGASPPVEPQETAKVDPLVLADSQAVAWSRTVSSWLFIGTTILTAALGVLLFAPPIMRDGFTAVGWTLIPYCAAVLLVAVFCAYRVSVDWRGLRVTLLSFAIPLKRIAPEQIAQVEAAVLEPTQWGGWQDRIMPGRSANYPPEAPAWSSRSATRNSSRSASTSQKSPQASSSDLSHHRCRSAGARSLLRKRTRSAEAHDAGKSAGDHCGSDFSAAVRHVRMGDRILIGRATRRTPLPHGRALVADSFLPPERSSTPGHSAASSQQRWR